MVSLKLFYLLIGIKGLFYFKNGEKDKNLKGKVKRIVPFDFILKYLNFSFMDYKTLRLFHAIIHNKILY